MSLHTNFLRVIGFCELQTIVFDIKLSEFDLLLDSIDTVYFQFVSSSNRGYIIPTLKSKQKNFINRILNRLVLFLIHLEFINRIIQCRGCFKYILIPVYQELFRILLCLNSLTIDGFTLGRDDGNALPVA